LIIDIHSHLGNILEHGGGDIINQTGVVIEKMFDPMTINEKGLMRTYGLGSIPYIIFHYWATKSQRARNAAASLENMQRSMSNAGVDYTVCMPIAPYVTFEDLAQARDKEKTIIPFTSIDFSRKHNIGKKLAQDVNRGAFGLKLHPIIQAVSLSDRRTLEALSAFEPLKKPVLTHSGVSGYYLGKEKKRNIPDFGQIHYVEEMVRTFPNINFIIGHSGLFHVHEVIRRLKRRNNVWVDTSIQSPSKIRKLIRNFGAERVMYASDWPFAKRKPSIQTVSTACMGDSGLEKRIFFENARDLLGLDV
jgi:predicted TIM-barrel fold metal-dependent hydrolase